jgi:hypothetical protein
MKQLGWRLATREQLINIAILDNEAPLEHRIAAQVELKRRERKRHARLNQRIKVVYPR